LRIGGAAGCTDNSRLCCLGTDVCVALRRFVRHREFPILPAMIAPAPATPETSGACGDTSKKLSVAERRQRDSTVQGFKVWENVSHLNEIIARNNRRSSRRCLRPMCLTRQKSSFKARDSASLRRSLRVRIALSQTNPYQTEALTLVRLRTISCSRRLEVERR
jgi:hypothetical protein